MSIAELVRRGGVWMLFPIALLATVAITTRGYAIDLLVVAALVPFICVTVRRPQLGLLVLVALAPFDGLRLLVEIPVVGAAWKFAVAGAVLGATFVCPRQARADRGRRLPTWCLPLFGLVAVGLASAVAVGVVQGLVGLKLDFAYLMVAWAAWRCPLSKRERDHLISILMVTGLVCAIVGLLQQLAGATALHDLGYGYNSTIRYIGNSLRSFSTFDNAPAFALYILIVLLMGLPQAFSDPSRTRNRLFLQLVPVYVLGLGSAFTRSALLGLAAGLLYLGVRRYRWVLAALPLVLVAFLLFGGHVVETVSSSTSLGERTTGWDENLRQVSAHPFGAGIGATGSAKETVNQITGAIDSRYQPDNYYFKTLYELGLIGLWMLVLLFAGALGAAHGLSKRVLGTDRAFADGVAAMVVAAVTAALVTSYLEIFPMDLLFWLLVTTVSTMAAGQAVSSDAAVPAVTSA